MLNHNKERLWKYNEKEKVEILITKKKPSTKCHPNTLFVYDTKLFGEIGNFANDACNIYNGSIRYSDISVIFFLYFAKCLAFNLS